MAEHGTYDGYVSGCRCRPCTAAAAHYQRRRRHWPTPNTPAAQRLASQSWRDQAACKGQPTEWWYPSGPDSTSIRQPRNHTRGRTHVTNTQIAFTQTDTEEEVM